MVLLNLVSGHYTGTSAQLSANLKLKLCFFLNSHFHDIFYHKLIINNNCTHPHDSLTVIVAVLPDFFEARQIVADHCPV